MAAVVGSGLALHAAEAGMQSPVLEPPDFPSILRVQARNLTAITSDAEALALFSTRLGALLDLKDAIAAITDQSPANKNPHGTASSDPTKAAVLLTAEMAAWRLAAAVKEAANAEDITALQSIQQEALPQQGWLLEGEERASLRQTVRYSAVLTSIRTIQVQDSDQPVGYEEYATYLDRTYPRLIGPDSSWLAMAEREGPAGLRRRLMEFWERAPQSHVDKEKLAARYFHIRLRPVLVAHLAALAIRAEAEAEQRTRAEWFRLRSWEDTVREMKGLARLCGTWQWTVHNHKHHQEHKMVLSFLPPGVGSPDGPRPTKIVVLGDAVYLRWEFQGGYQEDSLLFTGGSRRLEGTFTNSAGAWGSITGKRSTACSP
ncbi:MAG: hypothetical protein ACREIH_04850 [Nitrospiraceae bacterium]